jgi:hypothetical protein
MEYLKKKFPIDEELYDNGISTIREILGSYEKISRLVSEETGQQISAGTVRNWFISRRIPIEFAALFSELTGDRVEVADFFPWLTMYV